jgi:hypothetical protein
MAKISAEYDTKSKKLSVSKDGEAMANVHHVEFGRSYEQPEDTKEEDIKHICHIAMREKGDDGYSTHTHIVANEQGDLVKEETPVNKGLSGFIGGYLDRNRYRKGKN